MGAIAQGRAAGAHTQTGWVPSAGERSCLPAPRPARPTGARRAPCSSRPGCRWAKAPVPRGQARCLLHLPAPAARSPVSARWHCLPARASWQRRRPACHPQSVPLDQPSAARPRCGLAACDSCCRYPTRARATGPAAAGARWHRASWSVSMPTIQW